MRSDIMIYGQHKYRANVKAAQRALGAGACGAILAMLTGGSPLVLFFIAFSSVAVMTVLLDSPRETSAGGETPEVTRVPKLVVEQEGHQDQSPHRFQDFVNRQAKSGNDRNARFR